MTMTPATLKVVRKATKKANRVKDKFFNEDEADIQSINEDEFDYFKDFKIPYDFDEDRMVGDEEEEPSVTLTMRLGCWEKGVRASCHDGFGELDCVNESEYNNGSYSLRCVRPSAENINDIDNSEDIHLISATTDDEDEAAIEDHEDHIDVADFKDGPNELVKFYYGHDHDESNSRIEVEDTGDDCASFCSEDGTDDNDYNYIDDC